MHFVFFDDFRPGILRDGRVYDIASLLDAQALHSPQEVVEAFIARYAELKPELQKLSGTGIPVGSVRLRPPVPRPLQLLCAIRNYKEPGRTPEGGFFLKAPTSVVGPGDVVRLPNVQAKVFHFEAELAAVIGTGGGNIPRSEAMGHVFGYTAFIDASARESGNSFHMRKGYDTFGPMGPALVTADEIPDPHDLRVKLSVNGKVRQDFSTDDMYNRIDALVAQSSAIAPIVRGDVIATGTHHLGLGPIQEGDEVTLEIERIGSFTVRVEDPLHRRWDVE